MNSYDELMADRRARKGEDIRADRDRLAALNAELVGALEEQIEPRARNWKVTDWDIRDANARALIAKAREGKG